MSEDAHSRGGEPRRRAVLLVANAAAPYSRSLRVARSLAAAGWAVEIAAVADPSLPSEERENGVLTRRYVPSGWAPAVLDVLPRRGGRSRIRRLASRAIELTVKGVLWPVHVRGWWATLRRDLPPADLYHAFGILTVPVALELARQARTAGRAGVVVYDVIDAILDSNHYAAVPQPALAWYRRREAAWARRVDAVVTVNDGLADHCRAIWPFRERPTVVMNCQPRWRLPEPRPDVIREATGLPQHTKIVLYIGRLGRDRGLDEAAEAVLLLPDSALVHVGFGHYEAELRERDRSPRFAGRHFVLAAVPPDDVPQWAASADVSVIALPAGTPNQRLATPNKLWESLVAGTPVVVGHEMELVRDFVTEEGLGAVVDPGDPADLARGLRSILEQPAAGYQAMRARCFRICDERYNWETEVAKLLALDERLLRRKRGGR